MAADKNDEPGVLGNLPRSRPGHRSDKRGGRPAAAKAKAAKPRAPKAPSASATATARAARPVPPPRAEREAPRPRVEAEQHRSGAPLSAAVHLAGKVAEAGLKTAGDLLRRLPGR